MNEEQERQVMVWVRDLVRVHLGEEPGPERRRNGLPPDQELTIDYTFDGCRDPFALEITSLTDHFEAPSDRHLAQFERGLVKVAKVVGWADWFVGVRAETKLNPTLKQSVATMMRFAQELDLDELGAATFVGDLGPDLASRMRVEFYRACNQARLAGVIYVARRKRGGVRILMGEEWSDSRSVVRPLERAMTAKAKPLGVAKRRKYWTMLAIDVERQDAKDRLRARLVLPGMPAEIDHLWLVVSDAPGGALQDAYYAKRTDRRLTRIGAGG